MNKSNLTFPLNDSIDIVTMPNRFRPKLIHIYLHPEEDKFLRGYAEKNYLTVAELFRGWLHEVMKTDGYEIKEPSLPEKRKKGRK